MPYRLAEIAARYGVHYYPIVSSARAFRALWKRAYHKFRDWLGGVVYEDPWLAGGHNGLSNSEDPEKPEAPFPRVLRAAQADARVRASATRRSSWRAASGACSEWEDWIDNPELGPIAFQFGTRPLLTQESPISDAWKRKLLTLKEGDVLLNRFSPTGFYSSAVRNDFLSELRRAHEHQVAYTVEAVGEHLRRLGVGARGRIVYLTPHDRERAPTAGIARGLHRGVAHAGFDADLRHAGEGAGDPRGPDRLHGLPVSLPVLQLGAERGRHHRQEGRPAQLLHPEDAAERSAIQRRCRVIELMFAGHNAYRFASDPVLRQRLHPDGARAGRAAADRKLTAGAAAGRGAIGLCQARDPALELHSFVLAPPEP